MAGCLLRPRPPVLQQLRHPAAFTRLSQILFSAIKSALEMAPNVDVKTMDHSGYTSRLLISIGINWSERRDLNPRPLHPQCRE